MAIDTPFNHPTNLVTKILVTTKIWSPHIFLSPHIFDHHRNLITINFGHHRNLVATHFNRHMFWLPHILIATCFDYHSFSSPQVLVATTFGLHFCLQSLDHHIFGCWILIATFFSHHIFGRQLFGGHIFWSYNVFWLFQIHFCSKKTRKLKHF